MARLREQTIGWLRTVSGLDERSFPLGIKNINMKELLVIFPLIMVAIAFAFKDIMISMAALVPVVFVVFYEEKSLDEFQYVYYFLKFYVKDFMAPKETTRKKETKKLRQTNRANVSIMRPLNRNIDYILLGTGALMTLIAFPNVVKIFEFVTLPPEVMEKTALLFGIGAGVTIGEAMVILRGLKKK